MKRASRFTALVLAVVLAFAPAGASASSVHAAEFFSFLGKAAKRGWVTSGDRTYYYNKSGQRVKGIHKINGKYYIFNSNSGALLKNKIIYKYSATKYYKINKDGVATRFIGTSAKAAKLIYDKMRTATAFDMLKRAFQWVASSSFTSNVPEPGSGVSKATYYGQWGLTRHSGDCAVMAYTFYWMAKVLGYKVRVIDGYYVSGTNYKEHSWCEIVHNGTVYVYDPDFNLEFKNKITRTTYGFNSIGFKVRYGDKNTLPYCRPDKSRIENGGKA